MSTKEAWTYELATKISGEGEYSGWRQRLSFNKPSVPEGAIRNLTRLTTTTERVEGREELVEAGKRLVTLLHSDGQHSRAQMVAWLLAALSPSPAADVRREALEEAAKAAEGYALRQEEEGEGGGREWATAHAIANSIRTLAAPPVDQEQEK